MAKNYTEKLEKHKSYNAFSWLSEAQQIFTEATATQYQFTFQEFRQLVEIQRDLAMWGEPELEIWWKNQEQRLNGTADRKLKLWKQLQTYVSGLRHAAKSYPESGLKRPKKREKSNIVQVETGKKIAGMCPVASPKTVCCNLRTIDAVENCIFGCSYCTIQTFYSDKIVFDKDIGKKLQNIHLSPDRPYHYGTGQSSDSLAWGNRFGNLDALCDWARQHPNLMLEFKTKSDNISYFLENDPPPNIVCSWSMNPQTIIENEEHFTANLQKRIAAARRVADRGVKVSFHFHPMVYYDEWEHAYPAIAEKLQATFSPEEVLFVSFGSVTFIKPVIKKIRNMGLPSKILQMPLVPDPHGKYTYSDDIKVDMFSRQFAAFRSWQGNVFFYLCMEKAEIWQRTFGFAYPTNEEFEARFLENCMRKIYPNQELSFGFDNIKSPGT